jgi:hypothetical protein
MAFVEGSLASRPPTPGQGGTHDHCKFLWRGYRAKTVQQRCVHAVASRVAVDGCGYCANGKRDLDRIVRIRARQIALESGARASLPGRAGCDARPALRCQLRYIPDWSQWVARQWPSCPFGKSLQKRRSNDWRVSEKATQSKGPELFDSRRFAKATLRRWGRGVAGGTGRVLTARVAPPTVRLPIAADAPREFLLCRWRESMNAMPSRRPIIRARCKWHGNVCHVSSAAVLPRASRAHSSPRADGRSY